MQLGDLGVILIAAFVSLLLLIGGNMFLTSLFFSQAVSSPDLNASLNATGGYTALQDKLVNINNQLQSSSAVNNPFNVLTNGLYSIATTILSIPDLFISFLSLVSIFILSSVGINFGWAISILNSLIVCVILWGVLKFLSGRNYI